MYTLRYRKEDEVYEVDAVKRDAHHVEITGDYPVQTDGFIINREGYIDNWDYTQYTTIYKEILDGAIFSDDGSVEPENEEYLELEDE